MKLLLKENALQFETKEELITAIKTASQMLDFASDAAKICDSGETAISAQPEPVTVPKELIQTTPATVQETPMQQAAPVCVQPEPVPAIHKPENAQQAEPAPAIHKPENAQQAAPVPTAAPAYTIEEILKAAQGVADAGGTEALRGLLSEFGVIGVHDLSGDQLGAFALRLREIGGNI